ncbi:MAG: hypothetical protein IAE78_29410 [Myxococcus sp.]|nr:hypothetical protein [Myxococcus sp.]
MRLRLFWFAVLVGASFLVTSASCGQPNRCNSATCTTGCCDASNRCVSGNTSSQCGARGAVCASCSLGQTCDLGTCKGSFGTGAGTSGAGGGSTGTGGGFATGGGTGGGQSSCNQVNCNGCCTATGQCAPGTSPPACGSFTTTGGACLTCSGNETLSLIHI